jgi:hypothetical protein
MKDNWNVSRVQEAFQGEGRSMGTMLLINEEEAEKKGIS